MRVEFESSAPLRAIGKIPPLPTYTEPECDKRRQWALATPHNLIGDF